MRTIEFRLSLITVLITIAFAVPATCGTSSPHDILVFVNQSADIDSLSKSELEQIFLKKKTTWPSGQRIVSINASGTSSLREAFRAKVLDMREVDEATYWEKQRIRHQIEPPVEMTNTPKAVFKLKSAISYAYRKDVPEDVVKVVLAVWN
jgi:ABC-type phosphate transport system substrate-binding protein